MSLPADEPLRVRRSTQMTRGRRAGVWGWVFVVLLLLSAGMASTPSGQDATGTVRDFYARHAGVVITAQVIGLLAAAAFASFALALRPTAGLRARGALEIAGLCVAAAAVLTALPVLWLSVVAKGSSDGLVHGLAVTSDLTDVVLFAAIAAWATSVLRVAIPNWFKGFAGLVALLALARSILLLVGSDLLEVVAPLAFVLFVAVLSTLVLVRRSPLGST
jgi:hypothetical protein